MKTIGEKVTNFLELMQKTPWILNETNTEYLLIVPLDKADDFILNYMMRVGVTEMAQSQDKSFWYSWQDTFTGTITIHHTELNNQVGREKFVAKLLRAMNTTTQNLNASWVKLFSSPLIYTNEYISENTKNMIANIANAHGLDIGSYTGSNGSTRGVVCKNEEDFEKLRQYIAQQLSVSPLSESNQLKFFDKSGKGNGDNTLNEMLDNSLQKSN